MILTFDQSAAAMMVLEFTPLAADQVAAAALVEPAVSMVAASLRTETSHVAIVCFAAGRKGVTVVRNKRKILSLTRSFDVRLKYSIECPTGHRRGHS